MSGPAPNVRRLHVTLVAVAVGVALATPVEPQSPPSDLLAGQGFQLVTCEVGRLDVGTPEARPALLDGFYRDVGRRRTRACTGQRASLRIDLIEPIGRTLAIRTSTSVADQQLEVWWNDQPLGARDIGRRWRTATWQVPADSIRPGPNTLRLEAARTIPTGKRGRRPLGVCVDTVELSPAPCLDATASQPPNQPGVGLVPGAVLVLPIEPQPDQRLRLTARSEAGGSLEVHTLDRGTHRPAITLELAAGQAAEAEIRLPPCCGELAVVAQARGAGPVRVSTAEVTADLRTAAWRRACGIRVTTVALVLLLGILSATFHGLRLKLPSAGRWTPLLDLLVVAMVAIVARALFLEYHGPIQSGRFPDAVEYMNRSQRLADGAVDFWRHLKWHAWQTWIRPPGYYLLLAYTPLSALARLQAALSTLTALATYGIARPLFGRGAALFAGLAFAVYPEAVISATWVMSEPLYLALLVPGLAALAHTSARPRVASALLAGALLGLSALVRSGALYFVPLAAVLLLAAHGRRRAWRPALALVLAMSVVVLPWCIRNSILHGRPMGIDDVAIPNHLLSYPNQRFVPHLDLDLETPSGHGRYWWRLKRSNADQRVTREGGVITAGLLRHLTHPRERLPKMLRTARDYWRPAARHAVRRILGEERPCRLQAWTDAINGAYLFILGLGLAGLVLTLRDRRTWPVASWIVFLALVHGVLFFVLSSGRFRFPLMPVLMAFAGVGWVRLQAGLGSLVSRRRAGAVPASQRGKA